MTASYETLSDIETRCRHAGVSISGDQLRRWRDKGLMPPVKQAGKGRGAGSEIQFAIGSGTLAIEIQRLLRIKKKLDFVGWHLWLRGYEVDAQYWRPQIEAQSKLIKRLPALRRWTDIKYQNKNSTIFDEFDVEAFRVFPVFKPLSKLDQNSKAYILGIVAEIATGQFASFQSYASPDDRDDQRTFFSVLGFSKAEWAIDLARQLGFLDQLEMQLRTISSAFAEIQKGNVSAIETFDSHARMEFSDAIALASNMELLTSKAVGRNQSILNVGSKILNADNRQLQAQLFLIWYYFREQQTILSQIEIRRLFELTQILIISIEGIAEFKKALKKPN